MCFIKTAIFIIFSTKIITELENQSICITFSFNKIVHVPLTVLLRGFFQAVFMYSSLSSAPD